MNNNMIPIFYDNMAAKSRAHLALLGALGITDQNENSGPENTARAALAEAIAFPDNGEWTLGQLLSRAESALIFRDQERPHEAIIFDVDSLMARCGISRRMAQLVARLCGCSRQRGDGNVYADDSDAKSVLTFENFDYAG